MAFTVILSSPTSIAQFQGQDPSSAIYGNVTNAVDLAFYRDAIEAVVAVPEPDGGLWWGLAALLLLGRWRRQR